MRTRPCRPDRYGYISAGELPGLTALYIMAAVEQAG